MTVMPGKHAHQTDVLQDLVRGTVLTQRETRVAGADLHVLVGVGDALADLVVHAARAEVGEGAGEGDLALRW
jgi:hypothetical protein